MRAKLTALEFKDQESIMDAQGTMRNASRKVVAMIRLGNVGVSDKKKDISTTLTIEKVVMLKMKLSNFIKVLSTGSPE